MDFQDTPDEAAFRSQARAWLRANAPPVEVAQSMTRHSKNEVAALAAARIWQAKKADAGWACIDWPTEYGGRGATAIQRVIWDQEEAIYTPPMSFFDIGLGMCGPTLMAWASDAQKQRYLPPLRRGEELWCQLFSEPVAGSDLAGIRTRAARDGEAWVINGQKVWISGAHYCDYGIMVARSDPGVPKHKGLTFFFVDMKTPGIRVQPIKQLSGNANFNEVYFDDVRIPDSQRLGDVGRGWQVCLTTLSNERMAVEDAGVGFDDLFALARDLELENGPALRDAAVRQALANAYVRSRGLKYTKFRALTALSRGQEPGSEASIFKLVFATMQQEIVSYAMDLMDIGGSLLDPAFAPSSALFQKTFLTSPGLRIAGGTDEIMRNIIAERVLGLPQDVRLDKDRAFSDLPSGR